jgi:inhibitor of KinA
MFKLLYKSYGTHAILVEWPQKIEQSMLYDILAFNQKIASLNDENKLELRSAYNSLLIIYGKLSSFETEVDTLKSIYKTNSSEIKLESRLWKIPVCYEEGFGLDLNELSQVKHCSKQDIINRHAEVIYTVYFIGFLPGFLYLGGLDKTLSIDRKATPRLKIEKGSVAIGGNQTGIYPIESPGGWHVIGNSPIQFFNPTHSPPCFAKAGDRVQFYPVNIKNYKAIKTSVEKNTYTIESEVVYD